MFPHINDMSIKRYSNQKLLLINVCIVAASVVESCGLRATERVKIL
jgi:hypothetical protein